MTDYLQEQLRERSARWAAAVAEGPVAAERAAREAFGACREAVCLLGARLREVGFPDTGFALAPDDMEDQIARLRGGLDGPVSPLVQTFWRTAGGILFVDFEEYAHAAYWEDRGITGPNGFGDAIEVAPCSRLYVDHWLLEQEIARQGEYDDDEDFYLEMSADGYHKDDISGGYPYGVPLGQAWDPPWLYYEWPGYVRPVSAPPGQPTFMAYLRTAVLECAGFPGLLGHPAFEPIRRELIDGLPVF